jgi:hypothetical protein
LKTTSSRAFTAQGNSTETHAAGTKRNALQDLGWTTLSVTAAAALLPAIGLKALARAAFPKKAKASDAYEPHHLIQ